MVVIRGTNRNANGQRQMMAQHQQHQAQQSPPPAHSSTMSGRPLSTPITQVAEEDQEFPPQLLPLCPNLDLHLALSEALALEAKYQSNLSLSMFPRTVQEITGRMRNGSSHVLRCLKVWYALPSDTFFLAVNTMDRFLTKMKAQPKHLSCIAVSAFHVACEESSLASGRPVPSRENISAISQSKCTTGDVSRMEDIIRSKLDLAKRSAGAGNGLAAPVDTTPVTALTMLRLMHCGIRRFLESEGFGDAMPCLVKMVHKLEVVVCDTRASNFRASELALVLLQKEVKHSLVDKCLQGLYNMCSINLKSFTDCDTVVKQVLAEYEGLQQKVDPHQKQRLVWKVSHRTMRKLRPTIKLRKQPRLEALEESQQEEEDCQPRQHWLTRAELRRRSRTGKIFFYGDAEEEEQEESDDDEPMEEDQDHEMEDCCEELSMLYDMDIEDRQSSLEQEDMEADDCANEASSSSSASQPIAIPACNACTTVMIRQPRTPPLCYLPLSPPLTPPSVFSLTESYSQIAKKYQQESSKVNQPQPSPHHLPPPLTPPMPLTPPSPYSKITLLPAARNLSALIDAAAGTTDPPPARPQRSLAGLLVLSPEKPLARRRQGEKQRKVHNMRLKPKKQSRSSTRRAPPQPAPAASPLQYERDFPPLPPRPSPPARRQRPPHPVRVRKAALCRVRRRQQRC